MSNSSNSNGNKPTARPCSMCGQMLEPFVHGCLTDFDGKTTPCYGFGHYCPAQSRAYENRLKEIASLPQSQQTEARKMADYMNAWGS